MSETTPMSDERLNEIAVWANHYNNSKDPDGTERSYVLLCRELITEIRRLRVEARGKQRDLLDYRRDLNNQLIRVDELEAENRGLREKLKGTIRFVDGGKLQPMVYGTEENESEMSCE